MHTEPPVRLSEEQYTLTTAVVADDEGAVATILPSGSYIALDINVDAELEAEGYARDVVRAVQEARRSANLHVSDRIALTLGVPEKWVGAVERHIDFIAGETLAVRTRVETAAELTVDVEKA